MVNVSHGQVLVDREHTLVLLRNLAIVIHELVGRRERARDGATGLDLLHHGHLAADVAILAHAELRVARDSPARAIGKAVAANCVGLAAHVLGLVGQARVIRHRVRVQVLVDHDGVAAVAAGRRVLPSTGVWDAVVDGLATEAHVRELRLPCDLDAVVERGQGAMDPASTAVLGDVLVPGAGHVANTVDVTPVEGLGQVLLGNQLLARRAGDHMLAWQPLLGAPVAVEDQGLHIQSSRVQSAQ
mmetsp:Transcript_65798/g.169360  ORF Transcript_65798/g.169360 Transcript_65798/m.169360 type:complete len:243 (+) Transcript_65798:620-1348(+)